MSSTPFLLDEDQELRLECARLASVFSEPDAVMSNAERLYAFIKEGPNDPH